MDKLGNGETTHHRDGKDSGGRYLTVYFAINTLVYTLVGAYIGCRVGINNPFTIGNNTYSGGIVGGILGAVIGMAISIFLTGMSWDKLDAKELTGLIEGFGISLGFLFGLVIIVPSLFGLIERFGYGHLLSNSCVEIPFVLVGGMLGSAVGVLVGRILVKILNRINPQWAPEVQWRIDDKPKLEAYFKQMEDLNLSEDASDSVRNHAREITLAVLPTLHSEAKWKVLKYLSETGYRYPELRKGLITRGNPIIDLHGADLRGQCDWSDLYYFDLSGTDLRWARFGSAPMANIDLSGADLRQANLGTSLADADFSGADLRDADLYRANLSRANFSHADLRGADLRDAYGIETAIFDQTNYDSSTKWPEDFNPKF